MVTQLLLKDDLDKLRELYAGLSVASGHQRGKVNLEELKNAGIDLCYRLFLRSYP